MALFLDIHTKKYKDKRQVIWDMAEAMNAELLALRDAGCRLIQIEERRSTSWRNTFGKNHEEVLFLIDAFNRRFRDWTTASSGSTRAGATRTCSASWKTPATRTRLNLPRAPVVATFWTLEMKDRNQRDIELFAPFRNDLKKKISSARSATAPAGRSGGRCRRRNPPRAGAHPGRAAHRVQRLRLSAVRDATARSRSTRPARSRRGANRPRRAGPADDVYPSERIRSCKWMSWSASAHRRSEIRPHLTVNGICIGATPRSLNQVTPSRTRSMTSW